MLTLDQLKNMREVCEDALYAAYSVYETKQAADALADIDAEIAKLKGN